VERIGNKVDRISNQVERIGNEVERIGNEVERIGNKVEHIAVDHSLRFDFVADTFDFAADTFGNEVERIGNEVERIRQQSTLLRFVAVSATFDFQQSGPCLMQLCRQCVPTGLKTSSETEGLSLYSAADAGGC